jgi:chromosome segregation protein
MRGGSGSMEDVIFAGTSQRPARSSAEVSVLLDNTDRSAPNPFNTTDDIEVVRKIERDHGSGYRINGRPVRARDVQLLYADILSGANSPFLVSQGKITNIINAKPSERKLILEEAAGITGLYARRHEAELKLRATDQNLARVGDLIGGMEERLNSLKKQARQASRYRTLSAQIRQLEVMIACLDWRAAHEKLQEVERKFAGEESAVAERLVVVGQLGRTQTVQSQDLPELRHKEAEMSAAVQALRLALQRLEDESTRIENQRAELKGQLEQSRADREHEQRSLTENTGILERLESEEKTILATQNNEDSDLEAKGARRDELKEKVAGLESEANSFAEQHAADKARRQSLENQTANDRRRRDSVAQRLAEVKQRLEARKGESSADGEIAALRAGIEEAEKLGSEIRAGLDALAATLESARADRNEKRAAADAARTNRSKLEGEVNSLRGVVEMYDDDGFRPVLQDVQAGSGFETALSRALGDTLTASTEEDAPVVWTAAQVSVLPALPQGIAPLKDHVKAPEVLHAALSQIGFAASEEAARAALGRLAPGQSIVTADGAYWRWDGLYVKATAADRNALHLQQKNRLAALEKQLPEVQEAAEKAQAALQEAEAAITGHEQKTDELRTRLRTSETGAREQQTSLNRLIEAQASRQAELAKLEEAISLAEADIRQLDETIDGNAAQLAAFDDAKMQSQQERIERSRAALAEAREEYQDAIRAYDISRQEQNRRRARLQAIGDERVNLQNRSIRAGERVKELDEREKQLEARIEELKKRPAEIKKESEELLGRLSAQEGEKGKVSDRIAEIEAELNDTNRALKEAEAALSEAREQRAHSIATREERLSNMEGIRAYIQEQFGMSPEELNAEAALDENNLPVLDQLRQEKESNVRSRDLIGPVNLRADVEAQELEAELATILNERNDLQQAIDELRQGIQKLNKEARERLNIAFERVNGYFRDMFSRLFKGGSAHLALIESDDPLEAGLEIFAQPPGKALQSLSLLSGGEQTLTAIAVIFAMFLTNPAPICVLDEVDAPLDDANVDRVCDLLQEFAERGETRFLVITHHRLTMARMDRLYGVTMSERGVSQLVSVDLNQQLDFLEAAE